MVIATILLPIVSNVGSYGRNPDYERKKLRKEEEDEETETEETTATATATNTYLSQGYYVYQPPNERYGEEIVKTEGAEEKENTLKRVRHKLNSIKVTKDDVPVKLSVIDSDRIQRRVIGKESDLNKHNNEFDFDIDEFVNTEHIKDMREKYRM